MPQLPDLTRPIMRRAASLNADQTRRWGLEERQYFRPLQVPPQYCLASCIDAMQLEDPLGDVQTDCGNLHGGGSFSSLHSTARAWHIDAVRGRPPHQIRYTRIGASSLSWDTPATRRTWPQSGPTTAGPVSPARRKLPFRSIAARCPVASPGSQQSILDLIIGGGRHMQACANLVCCEMGLSAQPPTDTVPRTIRTMMANDRGPVGQAGQIPTADVPLDLRAQLGGQCRYTLANWTGSSRKTGPVVFE